MLNLENMMREHKMVKLRCSWCGLNFETTIGTTTVGKPERSQVKCPNCQRFLPSSIKEPTENVNRKHIHRDYK